MRRSLVLAYLLRELRIFAKAASILMEAVVVSMVMVVCLLLGRNFVSDDGIALTRTILWGEAGAFNVSLYPGNQ